MLWLMAAAACLPPSWECTLFNDTKYQFQIKQCWRRHTKLTLLISVSPSLGLRFEFQAELWGPNPSTALPKTCRNIIKYTTWKILKCALILKSSEFQSVKRFISYDPTYKETNIVSYFKDFFLIFLISATANLISLLSFPNQ